MQHPFTSRLGITVIRREAQIEYETALDGFAERLDSNRGALFSSGIDYPGRYTRWDFGFVSPPLEFVGRGRTLTVNALNARGGRLLQVLRPVFDDLGSARITEASEQQIVIEIGASDGFFAEEERSLQPSLFTPLRRLIAEFTGITDPFLGLYGAFGYDLLFQFEPIALRHQRPADHKDLHLFLPDSLLLVDRRKEQALRYDYEFVRGQLSTTGLDRDRLEGAGVIKAAAHTPGRPLVPVVGVPGVASDFTAEDYAALVDVARERMRVGDIFEVVLSRSFFAAYDGAPSGLFATLKKVNPSPYEFLIQMGDEQLIGTSPEMFVRVEGPRVESCPISGTVRRSDDPMIDADRLKWLMNSEKDEVELTMCTDVDRNDKARICRAGSVRLLGRRQIEGYVGLFHTVDHVEGMLRDGLTGIDAFLSHMWAVTLTGAPKKMAVEIIEAHEADPRYWYGAAIGAFMLNGNVNTGITIRTVHLKGGQLRYRAGSTLVWDSIGLEEEAETRTKATAFFRALAKPAMTAPAGPRGNTGSGSGRRVVLVDNEDSFVHTLADYFRQTGAEVATYRHGLPLEKLLATKPDLVVHSPGPGYPKQFGVPDLVRALAAEGVAQFGVCLGLQGMVEAFGGSLFVLPAPRHGKRWEISHDGTGLFQGVPSPTAVGAYHSLTARMSDFPDELAIIAITRTEAVPDPLVMAIRHRRLPLAAVQFHPESILTMTGRIGHRLIDNVIRELVTARPLAAE